MMKTVALLAVAGLAAATSDFQDDYLAVRLANRTAPANATNTTTPIKPIKPFRPTTKPISVQPQRISLNLKDLTKEEREIALRLMKKQLTRQAAVKTMVRRRPTNATVTNSTKPAQPKFKPTLLQHDDEYFVEVDDEFFAEDDEFFAEDDEFFAPMIKPFGKFNSTMIPRPKFGKTNSTMIPRPRLGGVRPQPRVNGTAIPRRMNSTATPKTGLKYGRFPVRPTFNKTVAADDEYFVEEVDDEFFAEEDDEFWVDIDDEFFAEDDEFFAEDDEFFAEDDDFFAARLNNKTETIKPTVKPIKTPIKTNSTKPVRPILPGRTMIPRPRLNATGIPRPQPRVNATVKPTLVKPTGIKPTRLPIKPTNKTLAADDEFFAEDDEFFADEDEFWVDIDDEFFAEDDEFFAEDDEFYAEDDEFFAEDDEFYAEDDEFFAEDDEFIAYRLPTNKTQAIKPTVKPAFNSTKPIRPVFGRPMIRPTIKPATNKTLAADDDEFFAEEDEFFAFRHNKTEAIKAQKNSTLHHLGGLLKDAKKEILHAKNATLHLVHSKNATKPVAPKKGFLGMF